MKEIIVPLVINIIDVKMLNTSHKPHYICTGRLQGQHKEQMDGCELSPGDPVTLEMSMKNKIL